MTCIRTSWHKQHKCIVRITQIKCVVRGALSWMLSYEALTAYSHMTIILFYIQFCVWLNDLSLSLEIECIAARTYTMLGPIRPSELPLPPPPSPPSLFPHHPHSATTVTTITIGNNNSRTAIHCFIARHKQRHCLS